MLLSQRESHELVFVRESEDSMKRDKSKKDFGR